MEKVGSDLRIRLEGQLEVVEDAVRRLRLLLAALERSDWMNQGDVYDLPNSAAAVAALGRKLREEASDEGRALLVTLTSLQTRANQLSQVRLSEIGIVGTLETLREHLPVQANVVLRSALRSQGLKWFLPVLLFSRAGVELFTKAHTLAGGFYLFGAVLVLALNLRKPRQAATPKDERLIVTPTTVVLGEMTFDRRHIECIRLEERSDTIWVLNVMRDGKEWHVKAVEDPEAWVPLLKATGIKASVHPFFGDLNALPPR